MLKLLADENLILAIVLGVRRSRPDIDFVRVQDVGLSGSDDADVLEWAARENRVVATHDVATMLPLANDRVANRLFMPGLIEIGPHISIRSAIEDLVLIAVCSDPDEWIGQVRFLPL
jgi:uncharacterized protein DUF5615